jgi:hypothetical protein
MRLVILATVIAFVGCESTAPADYSPAAVVKGQVVDGQGQPVPGLGIEVLILKESCASVPVLTVSDPEQIRTDGDGEFSGSFETLSSGPITVACMIVRTVDEEGATVAEILIEDSTEWTSPPQDTVVVQLTA